MTAKKLVIKNPILIGRHICTQAFGHYPGGVAEIIAVEPDPACPEIVLQVKHPTFGEIGVFDFEEVALWESTQDPRHLP
jgi:hypothetical protein